jgi:hypothetical protein
MGDDAKECDDDEVKGDDEANEDDDVLGGIIGGGDPSDDEVLGGTLTDDDVAAAADRDTSGSSLPFTGVALITFVVLGAGLIVFGYLFSHKRSQQI